MQDRAAAGSHVVTPARVVGKRTKTPRNAAVSEELMQAFRTRGRQKRIVRTILERENAPQGWRQTGVYSQVLQPQKIEFRIISTCIPIRTLKCQRAPIQPSP